MAAGNVRDQVVAISGASSGLGLAAAQALAAQGCRVVGGGRRFPRDGLGFETLARCAGVSVDDLRDALYASKIASYTQGFAMLQAASAERGYGTDMSEVARIWTAGCIIRARFLDRVQKAFATKPSLLALAPEFVEDLKKRTPGWRRVVTAATASGLPIPGLSASLAWFDTLSTARGSANVIQAQRDYFGSHTYERTNAPGVAVHTEWKAAKRPPSP